MSSKDVIAPDELFVMSRDEELNADILQKFIGKHKKLITDRYNKFYEAYINNYPILNLKDKEAWKPDNRITVNLAKYIVDTFNGFFIGVPIKLTSKNKAVAEYINMLNSYNDQDDNNAELSKIMSLYGKGYELYFVDEESKICITYLSPREGFMIYDDTVTQKPLYFVHYQMEEENVIYGQVYDDTSIYSFNSKANYALTDDNSTPHAFGDVPVTEYIENEERMAIFESSYSMINAYNKAISEKANDVDYFSDAYLKILGAKLDTETTKNIRENRIINFEGEEADKIIVEFLGKPDADASQENHINRLERLIYQTSMVANINDENFATSSGIALKYKLLSMSNLGKTKERKFTSGMNRRYKLIFNHPLSKVGKDDWLQIDYKFTQNIPANLLDEAQIAAQLSGIVSKDTQLELLSVVDNVENEKKLLIEQNDPTAYKTDYETKRTKVKENELLE